MRILSNWYQTIKRRPKSRLRLIWEIKIIKRIPIIVYQMGKVGSKSVTDSLVEHGLHPVVHIHRMNPSNIKSVRAEHLKHKQKPKNEQIGLWLYKNICRNERQEAKVITLVREPISRNISAFFENYQRFTGCKYKGSNLQTDKLIKLFFSGYVHEVPLTWFNNEIKQTLGIDVYEFKFPKEHGYLEIRDRRLELLVIKTEIPDQSKAAAIAKFLDLEDLQLKRSNIGNQKIYSDAYQEFRKKICLPVSYVDQMVESKYAQHFYSIGE
jgi:hypothetical protein